MSTITDFRLSSSSAIKRATQRAPGRRFSGVGALGPAKNIAGLSPAKSSRASVEIVDKENAGIGASQGKRRYTVTGIGNASNIPASPTNNSSPKRVRSPRSKGKSKFGGRRVSFSSEIAVRKLRRESAGPYEDAQYEDSTVVMKTSPTALGIAAAAAPTDAVASSLPPILDASNIAPPAPVAETGISLPQSPARPSVIPAPAYHVESTSPAAAVATAAPIPSTASPSLQELLREDALTLNASAMDLTNIAPSAPSPAVQPSPAPPPAQVLVSPVVRSSPPPLDDGPSIANLSLSALDSPAPMMRPSDTFTTSANAAAAAVAASPARSTHLLPPASPGAALAAVFTNAANVSIAPEASVDITATLQQQLNGNDTMDLTRPVGGILAADDPSNASANITSDADKLLSLNSTSASVDMSLTAGVLSNYLTTVPPSPAIPPTPQSANSTMNLTAALSVLRSAPPAAITGHTADVFSGLLAQQPIAAPDEVAAAPPTPSADGTTTMDLTRVLGGMNASTAAAEQPTPSRSTRRESRPASPSDLIALNENTTDLTGIVPRALDFGAQAPTGEVSMDFTAAVGAVHLGGDARAEEAAGGSNDTTSVAMALTEAIRAPILTALPVVPTIEAAAPADTTITHTNSQLINITAPSPAPFATPARGARLLSAEEFYVRANTRFLPVETPAPPQLGVAASFPVVVAAPPPLNELLLAAAVAANTVDVYSTAAKELSDSVLASIENNIGEIEALLSRHNPPIFADLQRNRADFLAAQQQLMTSKSTARTQARSQWAKFRSVVETRLHSRIAPIAESLRVDLATLGARRTLLRELTFRVAADRDALLPAIAPSAQNAAHAKAEAELAEQKKIYSQLVSLAGWRIADINAAGIAMQWRDSVELRINGAVGTFTDVQCIVLEGASTSMRSLINSARIPAIFASSASRSTSALPSLLQSVAVRLGRIDSLLAEIKKISGRYIAHQVPLEDSLRLQVDFSSSPAGGSNARTRFTVTFNLDAMYPFSDLSFELCPHFGDVTNNDVSAIVNLYTSFQRLTKICADLQGIAQ